LGVYGQNNELGSNDVLISSLYGGKPLEVDEMYPYSPSELGRTNSWWLTAVPAATYTGVPLNTWTWQLLTARFWKEIILMKGTGVRHLLTWIQLSDNQVGPNTNANPYVELESGGQDAYAGWDEYSGCCSIGAYNYDDISGIGPRTPYDGQMMLSWWLNGATSITNWLSGTSLNVVSELGSYNSGTPGLHFWEWQFANGTTNTFVWADEVTTVTTNLGVGLTDIFSNQWTGPIDMTPVIAWNWPQ
jgi:hypothetical protein